ncbi:hypothetical protein [Filimonas lacunae]|nr:hypothetical protein [Filimonas lacunae]
MYKLTLSVSEMLALSEALDETAAYMQEQRNNNLLSKEDLLLLAVLEEMNMHFALKAYRRQNKYQLSLKPCWAVALDLQFNGFTDKSSYQGNLVQGICNKLQLQPA